MTYFMSYSLLNDVLHDCHDDVMYVCHVRDTCLGGYDVLEMHVQECHEGMYVCMMNDDVA